MRIFVNSVSTYVAKPLVAQLVAEGHEIVGSTNDLTLLEKGMEGVVELVSSTNKDGVAELVASAEVTILSLHDGGFRDKSAILRSFNSDELSGQKKLICLSSVMTWAKTPKSSPEAVLYEDDFMSRKPASKFTTFRTVETEVLSTKRPGVSPCVVAAGLLYGGAGGNLSCLMRDAWMMETDDLRVPNADSGGSNSLPTIHIVDLAAFVCKLIASECPVVAKKQYMVAVDKSLSTLRDVSTAVSRELGSGAVRNTTREEAEEMMLDEPELTQLQIDLRFEVEGDSAMTLLAAAGSMKYSDGPCANMKTIAAQFRQERDLRPLRIVVTGPPGSGVRPCCEQLAKKYVLTVVDEAAAIANATDTDEEEGKEAELKAEVEAAVAGGGLPAPLKARLLRKLLISKRCRNQGFILAGSPGNYDEAVNLFVNFAKDDEGVATDAVPVDPEAYVLRANAQPSHVVVFKSEDDGWLKQQYLAWWEQEQAKKAEAAAAAAAEEGKEADAAPTEADAEAEFSKLLGAFRDGNKDDDEKNPVTFFEKSCELETLNVAAEEEDTQESVVNYIAGGEGAPCNFHPTKEEVAAEERQRKHQAEEAAAAAARESEEKQLREEDEKREKAEARAAREEEVRKQETEMLEARSLPLRKYLMANVIPTLTEGMLEVVKMKPEDPIDYLAEYLFKKNVKSEEELAAQAKDQGM